MNALSTAREGCRQLQAESTSRLAELTALRADNARLREALDKIIDATFDDAVNGHLNHAQQISMAGIGEVYETARAALKAQP